MFRFLCLCLANEEISDWRPKVLKSEGTILLMSSRSLETYFFINTVAKYIIYNIAIVHGNHVKDGHWTMFNFDLKGMPRLFTNNRWLCHELTNYWVLQLILVSLLNFLTNHKTNIFLAGLPKKMVSVVKLKWSATGFPSAHLLPPPKSSLHPNPPPSRLPIKAHTFSHNNLGKAWKTQVRE